MLFFGGEALRDFSLALLIGIVIGAYSSIYIASPVMMALYKEDKIKALKSAFLLNKELLETSEINLLYYF